MQITIRQALPRELDAAGALTATAYRDESLALPSYLPRLADAAARHAAADTWQLVAVDSDGDGGRDGKDSGDGDDGGAGRGTVVGAAVYTLAGSEFADIAAGAEAELRMLATARAVRGRGVGEALVRHCIERARAEGRVALVLSTKPEMQAAQRLYRRLGFVRIPERDWEYAPGRSLMAFRLPLL